MKKIFLFAAAAAMFAACSNEDLAVSENAQQKAGEAPISFSVYTPRNVTRAGAASNDGSDPAKYGMNNDKLKTQGFGILAYYTDDEKYDADKSTPNFMYNSKVTYASSKWQYNPVMYWPNEFSAAHAENIDRVSFFAYAPYVEVDNTTGIPYADGTGADKTLVTNDEKNITAISKNTATGDPYVKYVVDTDPATSVDLLWGVAADNAATRYEAIDQPASGVTVTPGLPFLNLVKPNVPTLADGGVLNFNMCHALSKLNIDVKYIADAKTNPEEASKDINADETRIYIRSITIGGFVMKGALDLNNKDRYEVSTIDPKQYRGKALWKDYDGKSALSYDENVKFFDGRKDGKEGTESGENPNESYLGLNPYLLENYVNDVWGGTTWTAKKNQGVTKTAVNLFGNDNNGDLKDKPIYVIPVGLPIDITIEYDVLTADGNLSTFLSDGLTHGSMINNTISKKSYEIFNTGTTPVKMEDGKAYTIHILLGMTSVKIEATVTDYLEEEATANLPQNQD